MQITVFEKRVMDIKDSAGQRIANATQNNLCLACLEPLAAVHKEDGSFKRWDEIRQLHPKCYHATMRAIRGGKTTESQRMAEGKLGEKGPYGPMPRNPVTIDVS